jgi:hypothetical protein
MVNQMALKYKHIDASREVRLWIGQVIVPACVAGLIAWSNPKVRTYVHDVKDKIKSKFRKK